MLCMASTLSNCSRPSSLGISGHDALSKLPRDAGAGQGMHQEEPHARTLCKPESFGDAPPKQKGMPRT